jgi:cationic outer membrane protein ompH
MKKVMIIAAMALVCAAASAQQKFAHVNFQEIVQLMPEMDSARVQTETASKEANETYAAMVQEFQSKYQQFEQKQASWTPAVRESKQRELGEIQNRIQEFEQAIQQDLQQLQNQLMAPIYQKAQGVVNDIAKKQGFIYVFDASQVLYVDPAQSTDITKEARTALGIPEGRTIETLQAELQAKAAAAQAQ